MSSPKSKNLEKNNSNKLWAGRFSKKNNKLMEAFNTSLPFDKVFYREDIEGSIIHSQMLERIGVLTKKEAVIIKNGLEKIQEKFSNNQITLDYQDEDIHTKVENELRKEIGDLAGKLHTARSRNDQSNLDVRLYLRKAIDEHLSDLKKLLQTLYQLAEVNQKVIMPGHTHLQPAQAITLSYYFLAYFFMFQRDGIRLSNARERVDSLSLGAGALAGVNYSVDREWMRKKLHFKKIFENSMDAVSDRDHLIEYQSASAIIMMHLSRLCEELIIFSTPQFNFIKVDEQFSTGSSIMPNKVNPDSLELIRGKSGRIYGNLFSILTTMKSLPLAYNKDLQEDKENTIDTITTLKLSIQVITGVLETMIIYPEKMLLACEKGYLQATDVADYLVKKKLPFRDAHQVSASIVKYLEKNQKTFKQIDLAEFKKFSPLFEKDIFQVIELEKLIKNKTSLGSTSFNSVKKQLRIAKQILSKL